MGIPKVPKYYDSVFSGNKTYGGYYDSIFYPLYWKSIWGPPQSNGPYSLQHN